MYIIKTFNNIYRVTHAIQRPISHYSDFSLYLCVYMCVYNIRTCSSKVIPKLDFKVRFCNYVFLFNLVDV